MSLSKNFRVPIASLVVITAVLAAIFTAPSSLSETERSLRNPKSAGRSEGQQAPATTSAARNAALISATDEVLKETSDLRQLSVLQPVQSSTQSRAEIERMIVKNLDTGMTVAETHAAEIGLKKLGLASADFQYRAFMIRLLSEQVAGYYDPKVKQFHLADWIDVDGQRPVMAHELTHALQDQHFNLRRFEHWPKSDSDAQLATHALIEGDATLVMILYIANNPMRALAFLKSLSATGMSTEELATAPRALRETLLFPYQEGTAWTRVLYKQGRWEQVSRAFSELPQSTEQILHPEKYFAHEAPMKLSLRDIAPLLNASAGKPVKDEKSSKPARISSLSPHPSSFPAAWHRIDYDVEGEWGFYLILDQFLKSPSESRRAAAGWGGDRYEIYEGPNGATLFVSTSLWDTQKDAREFFDAYVKRTELRYPDAETTTVADSKTATSQPMSQQMTTWKTAEGPVSVKLDGARVLIIEASPASMNIKSLLKL